MAVFAIGWTFLGNHQSRAMFISIHSRSAYHSFVFVSFRLLFHSFILHSFSQSLIPLRQEVTRVIFREK